MKFAPVLAVALGGLAFTGVAQAEDTPTTEATEQSKPKDRVICKRETNVGSNIAPKVCRKESEWRAEIERARRAFEERDKD